MRCKIWIIWLLALFIALCWINPIDAAIRDDARMVVEAETIGQITMPCGHPGLITFIKPGEYALIIPAHKDAYTIAVVQENGKVTITMKRFDDSWQDVYKAIPPYDKWWSEGLQEHLIEGMLGFEVMDMVRVHFQKGTKSAS